jgi:NAD(P)-dependent dehydrogenase (short-subunit alcohol dehydrogenase family)
MIHFIPFGILYLDDMSQIFVLSGNIKGKQERTMSETGRTIVITGASSGFGGAAARAFADRGDRVWGAMRDTAGRNAAKKAELESYSARIAVAEMDVNSDASVAEGFARILAEGPVDILINNAGVMYIGMTEAYSVEQAREQMDTNYFGAIRAMQAVLPSMRAAGSGLIINTSSIAGRVSVPFFGTYCATKHALEAYSQSLRYEVAPFGVDVALVEPGPFPSNLLAAGKAPARADVLASYGDLGQVPTDMIAGFAQMLASDDAPDPQLVIDAYLALADAAPGDRPTRTVVGITWGVDEINAFTQPRQDAVLREMQLEGVLGGADV